MCSIGVPSIFRLEEFTILFVFLNIMNFDFAAFNDSRFIFSHSDILINYLFFLSDIIILSCSGIKIFTRAEKCSVIGVH